MGLTVDAFTFINYRRPHYNVITKGIEVGGEAMQFSTGIWGLFDDENKQLLTVAQLWPYLPGDIYDSIMSKVCVPSYEEIFINHT